ncbi:MAG: peptidylprolyl isomerase [Myxococcota bacterium]
MRTLVFSLALVVVFACDEEPEATPAETPVEPTEPTLEPEAEPAPPADSEEACVLGVVVAWNEATPAPPDVTRTEAEARAKAEALHARLSAGESIETLARAESDAPTSRARGGAMGTWTREDWPEMHGALKDPIFGVGVGMHPEVIQAPYGFVVAERCPIEKVHTRHILVRYAGARNAPDDVTRDADAARALAEELRESVVSGTDFAEVARERSEDSSAERGGDLGNVGRGLLMPTYEAAAFALEAEGISDVVESPFGFHVIQRL